MPKQQELPRNISEWRSRAAQKGVKANSLHTAKLTSASTIKEEQYLRLHVLWKESGIKEFDWELAGLDEWKSDAKEMLAGYESWKFYCDSLLADRIPESTFALAQVAQRHAANVESDEMNPSVAVTPQQGPPLRRSSRLQPIPLSFEGQTAAPDNSTPKTPKTPSYDTDDEEDDNESRIELQDTPASLASPGDPQVRLQMYSATEDEQIVNTALINYLEALIAHSGLPLRWSLHRVPLKANFGNKSYEARTDGYLQTTRGNARDERRDKKIRALVEAKAVLRDLKGASIRMQEAAQTVAWLKTHPDHQGLLNQRGRRVHISQNRHEIFIIIAEYDDKYLSYLKNETSGQNTFMKMHEFGPWSTQDLNHMRHLTPILVAIMLRAHADYEAESKSAGSQ